MPEPKLAEHARDALEAFREIEAGCAHLCGCRRASSVVDSTIRIALELGGWTVRGLAAHMGVSPGLIQKRGRPLRVTLKEEEFNDDWTPHPAPYPMGVAVGELHCPRLGVAAAPPFVVWRLRRGLRVVSHGRSTLEHSGPAGPGTGQGGTP